MFRILAVILAVIGSVWIAQQLYPDVERYLKLRAM
jgi:hypothetical protein